MVSSRSPDGKDWPGERRDDRDGTESGAYRVACVGDGRASDVLADDPAATVTEVCRAEEAPDSGGDCVVVTSAATVPAAVERVDERHPDVPTVACARDPDVVDAVRGTATEFFRPPPENGNGAGWKLLSQRVETAVERADERRRRQDRERRLQRLLNVTRDLLTANSRGAVAELTSEAAGEVLAFAGTGVRLYDPDAEVLRSVSIGASVETDERPPYPVEGTPHGRAFRSGETVVESVESDDPYDRDPFRSVMYVPIGEYGLLSVGVTETELTPTDRRLAELLAASSEAAFRRQERERELLVRTRAMAVADIGLTLVDEGTITWANEGFAEITGYDREAVVGHGVSVFEGPETDPETAARLREAVSRAEPASLVVQSRRADGAPFWARVEVTPITDATGESLRQVCSVTDITREVERERRLEALAAVKRSLAAAETTADVVSAVRTADLAALEFAGVGVRRYDPETERLLPVATNGDVPSEGERRPVDLDAPPGRAYRTGEAVTRVVPGGETEAGTPYGEVLYVPVDDHGVLSVVADDGAVDDVDRRIGELLGTGVAAALDRSRRRDTLELYGEVIETTQGMVYATDDDGRLTLVTEPLAAAVGVDRETLLGTPAAETLAPEVTTDGAGRVETTLSGPDGQTPVAVDVSPLSEGGVVGIVHDRSELAATRDELLAQRERVEVLFEFMPDPVCEVRLEADRNVLVDVNPAFESTFGHDREDLVGADINEMIVPDDQGELAEALDDRARDGGVVTETVRRVTADGVRDFLFHGIPFGGGDRGRAFGVYVDISDQKRRERRLEVLNRVLRHNLRSKTTVVRGYAGIVAERVEDLDDESETALERLRSASADIADIGDLARSVQRCLERETEGPVDLVSVVEPLAERYREEGVDVRLDLPATLPASTSGSAELALEQLLENAAEHVASPTVRIEGEHGDQGVRLSVTDDGPGIPEGELSVVTGDRTPTQLEHASGLGLWAVRWTVENDGGLVRFETPEDEGVGTRVTIEVPAGDTTVAGPGE